MCDQTEGDATNAKMAMNARLGAMAMGNECLTERDKHQTGN
jgi:hypothetical protein